MMRREEFARICHCECPYIPVGVACFVRTPKSLVVVVKKRKVDDDSP